MAAVCLWVVCGLQCLKRPRLFRCGESLCLWRLDWSSLYCCLNSWLLVFNVGLLIILKKNPFCLMLILKHMSVYKNHLSHFTASKVFWINILQCSLTQSYKYWPYLCLFVLNQGCHVHIYSFWYLNMRRRRAISAGHLSILYKIK